MKWDKKGAVEALSVKECAVCERVREVYVVVTVHGKKDLHFPCCSPECAEDIAEITAGVALGKR